MVGKNKDSEIVAAAFKIGKHRLQNTLVDVLDRLDLVVKFAAVTAFVGSLDVDVYEAIDLLTCVSQRKLPGGPAPEAVKATIEATRARIG